MKKKIMTLWILFFSICLGVVYADMIYRIQLPSTGTVKALNVGIYWDEALTQPITQVTWGLVEPGENYSAQVYVENFGNANVTLLMYAVNWDSLLAEQHITMIWNREGYLLEVNSYVSAILVLTVSSDIRDVTSFAFDIVVEGIG